MQSCVNPSIYSLTNRLCSRRNYPPGGSAVVAAAPSDIDQLLLDGTNAAHYTTAEWPGFEHLLADRKYTVGTLRTPRAGRCWLFDGSDDYATRGARLTSGSISTLTVSCWVKCTAGTGNAFVSEYSSGNAQWTIGCFNDAGFATANKFTVWLSTDGGTTNFKAYSSATSINDGAWHHCAFTWDNGTLKLYVDGVEETTTKHKDVSFTTIFSSTNHLFVGGLSNQVYRGAKSVRDVRVYSSAKSAAEILTIKNQASTPGTYDTTGLLAGYWCEEESGTTGYDWSGHGRHLTLTSITQSTFHAADTGVTYSDANVRGYRLSGSVYIPATSSTLAADGNALTVTGKCPQPGYAPQRVVTGDGSSVYVDLGSTLIPSSSDFSLEFAYYPSGTLTNRGPLTQGNNTGTASRFGLYHLDESTISLLVDHVSGVGTGAVSIAITKDAWSTIRVTKSGSSYTLSVNGTSSSMTNTGTITQSTNTQILRYSGCVSGRVSNLKVTTGGTTTYFPLCEGPGSGNTNRDVYYLKSDNTSGVVSSAIVNGTVSTIWANATDYTSGVFNWPLRYGYTVNGSGVIVPAKLNGASDAAGNAIGQAAGGWASGLQNLNCLPYTNPLGVSVGLETSLDPTADRKTTSSSKRRRQNTSGRYDRFGARSTAMSDASSNAYFGD